MNVITALEQEHGTEPEIAPTLCLTVMEGKNILTRHVGNFALIKLQCFNSQCNSELSYLSVMKSWTKIRNGTF